MYYLGRLSDKDITSFAINAYKSIFNNKDVSVKELNRNEKDVTLRMQTNFYDDVAKENVCDVFYLRLCDFKVECTSAFTKNRLDKCWAKFLEEKFPGYQSTYKNLKMKEYEEKIDELFR